MRISGGKARGIPLRVNSKNGVRPAIETTRERLFSSISNLLPQIRALDLFAGSGAYGLEALSRGAAEITLVENNRKVFADLKVNLAAVLKSAKLEGSAGRLVNRNVMDFLKSKPNQPYDIIFIDPPYMEIDRLCPQIFDIIRQENFLTRNGRIILESPGEKVLQFTGWEIAKVLGKEKRGSPVHRIYLPAQPLPAQ